MLEKLTDFVSEFVYEPWQASLTALKIPVQAEIVTPAATVVQNNHPASVGSSSSTTSNPDKHLVKLTLQLPFALKGKDELRKALADNLRIRSLMVNEFVYGLDFIEFLNKASFTIEIVTKVAPRFFKSQAQAVKGIKNIIAVSSAKGGVGKSTVSVNLACALAHSGVKVGILDADIYGPSIPHMLNASHLKPTSPDQQTMDPIRVYDLQANSIGFLVGETDPTIWRGPVASQMLKQLVVETNWDVDYLIVDMPPGTGDIQLTVSQNLPINAAVIVSTPQEIALLDVLKGFNMYQKVDIPVLGFVENMAMYQCEKCGHQAHIFGKDGVQELGAILEQPVLASLPLDITLRKDLDEGIPTVAKSPDSELAKLFYALADKVSFNLYRQVKSAAPTINIKSL